MLSIVAGSPGDTLGVPLKGYHKGTIRVPLKGSIREGRNYSRVL